MLEASKVCLVRCPKCENLLPEPTDSSVYQCGGCGTVLRAKKKGILDNEDLGVSNEQKIRGVSDKVDSDAAGMVVDFEAEKAKKGFKPGELDEEGTFRINKLLVTEKLGKMGPRTYKNRNIGSNDDRFKHSSDVSSDSRFNTDRNPYGGLSFEHKVQEFMPSKPVLNPRNMDRSHMLSTSSNANHVEAQRGFRKLYYPDEGPSYHGICSYGTYTEQAKYENQLDMRARVEILENDRAELLKKLDELAGMLKNTNNPEDEPREIRFRDPRIPPDSGHSYMPPGHGYDSNMDRHGSSRNPMQEYRGFGDVYNPQMLRLHNKYFQGLSYESKDINRDSFMPEPHETSYHMPTGSCMHGLNYNPHLNRASLSPIFRRQTYSHVNPVVHGPRGYVTAESNDLGMETSGFGHRSLNKLVVTQKDRRVFQPFSGGAPLITCCNCFKVLKMPRKFTLIKEIRNMMKCGACSSLLLFEFENNGMILSVPAENEQEFRHPRGFPNTRASNSYDEYENFTFLEDNEPKTGSDVGKSGHDQHSLSSMASVDEPSRDGMGEVSLGLPDSPCDKYLDQISSDNKTCRQNSSKDALMATEMYVSYDDTPTEVADQCMSDISKDSGQPQPRIINKMADSFFKGFIKKSFRDFSKSRKITESRRTRVSVNGHVISNWIVKKAEKTAGPIQPGDYWYDYEAGFWGVMGHPCLGIIPPSIDEFNYAMPESCGGGNTEIFLNGRELHVKDLDLLSRRGLPTTKNKSYLIEISGIAVDEDTGEELHLGKLAPTVEIAQHGFGMKVPKSIQKQ